MDSDVAQALIFPLIFLVHADAHQMGHNFGQPVVVISFDPDTSTFTLGIGKLADEAEKFSSALFSVPEIEVGENIAQQNKAAILILLRTRNASRARLMSAPRCRSKGSACHRSACH